MVELTKTQTIKMIKELKNASRLHANQAKRLEKRAKSQEGRAERKATKNDKTLSRGEKRKEIIDSRKKQKAKVDL